MPRLVLGPLLRYVSDTEATVWVETDAPCEVDVLGFSAATFEVGGHHYALVRARRAPGRQHAALRGSHRRRDVLAAAGRPVSAVRHPHPHARRVAAPGLRLVPRVACRTPSRTSAARTDDPRGREVDALLALVERMRDEPSSEWPDALLLLGDQVYADEVSPETQQAHRTPVAAHDGPPPGRGRPTSRSTRALYRESWSDPALRWLLSTVSSAMIFDDHDVHDDWNISEAWIAQMRAKPWWEERVVGAYVSYWIYQHLGNLSPARLLDDPIFCAVQDAERRLHRARARLRAQRRRTRSPGARWSFHRDFGRTRLVVVDSRAGRVLAEGRRADARRDAEWEWIEEQLLGRLRPPRHRDLAAGPARRRACTTSRRGTRRSATAPGAAWRRAPARRSARPSTSSTGPRSSTASGGCRCCSRTSRPAVAGRAPATIVLLSGDVHHAYLAEAWFPGREVDEPRPAGDVLAGPQPARQARAARAARGVHPPGGRCRARAGARRRRRASRRCAGRSRSRRRSTTRSPAWTSSGARRSCCIEKTVPAGLARPAPALRPVARDRAEDGAERALSQPSRCDPKAAQAQRVRDDEDARQRHRGAGDHRVQQPGRGERQARDVVAERPEEVALDRAQRAPREAQRVGGGAQVARRRA